MEELEIDPMSPMGKHGNDIASIAMSAVFELDQAGQLSSDDPEDHSIVCDIVADAVAKKPSKLELSKDTWCEIGNMLDFWEQLSNDARGMLEEERPELIEALDKIANSDEFQAEK